MAGSSVVFSVIWRLCKSQQAEQSRARSVPGQDLSLLPTSSLCMAAKPPLGKGLNFGFWPPSVPHPVSLCCANRKNSRGWNQIAERTGLLLRWVDIQMHNPVLFLDGLQFET